MQTNRLQTIGSDAWSDSQLALTRSNRDTFTTISLFSGAAAGYMLIKFTATPLVLLGSGCLALLAIAYLVKACVARTQYLKGQNSQRLRQQAIEEERRQQQDLERARRIEAERKEDEQREFLKKQTLRETGRASSEKENFQQDMIGPMSFASLKQKHGENFLTHVYRLCHVSTWVTLRTKFYCYALDQGLTHAQMARTSDYSLMRIPLSAFSSSDCYDALLAAKTEEYSTLVRRFRKDILSEICACDPALKETFNLRVRDVVASSLQRHILADNTIHLDNLNAYLNELDLFDERITKELRKAIHERDLAQMTFQNLVGSDAPLGIRMLLSEFPDAKEALRKKFFEEIYKNANFFARHYSYNPEKETLELLGIAPDELEPVLAIHLEKFKNTPTFTEIVRDFQFLIRSGRFPIQDLPHTRRLVLTTFNADIKNIEKSVRNGLQTYFFSYDSNQADELNFIFGTYLLPKELRTLIDSYYKEKYLSLKKIRNDAWEVVFTAYNLACKEALKAQQAALEKIALIKKEVEYDAKKQAKDEGEQKLRHAENALDHSQTELAKAQKLLSQNQQQQSILAEKISEAEKLDVDAIGKEASALQSIIAKLEADLKAAIDSPDINSQVDLDIEKVLGNPEDDDNLSITMPSMSFVNAAEQPFQEQIAHYQSQLAPLQAKLKNYQELEQTRKELTAITTLVKNFEKDILRLRKTVDDAQAAKDKASSDCETLSKPYKEIASQVEGPTAEAQAAYDSACKKALEAQNNEIAKIDKVFNDQLAVLVKELQGHIQKELNALKVIP